jgi:hypothetical protein
MNTTTIKKSPAIRSLETQLQGVKNILQELQETVADLEDAFLIEKAKIRNGKKPLLDWEDVAKELGIKPPPKRTK